MNRRESHLYAEKLENEHKKARVLLAMSPEEKKNYKAHEKRVAQGCKRLHELMVRLQIEHQFNMFSKRKITYERAKKMTAREFVALGHRESRRIHARVGSLGRIFAVLDVQKLGTLRLCGLFHAFGRGRCLLRLLL